MFYVMQRTIKELNAVSRSGLCFMNKLLATELKAIHTQQYEKYLSPHDLVTHRS
jgi:hypothetical protein